MKFSGPRARVPLPSVCSSVLNSVSDVHPTKAESGMVNGNDMDALLVQGLSLKRIVLRFGLFLNALRAKVIVAVDWLVPVQLPASMTASVRLSSTLLI